MGQLSSGVSKSSFRLGLLGERVVPRFMFNGGFQRTPKSALIVWDWPRKGNLYVLLPSCLPQRDLSGGPRTARGFFGKKRLLGDRSRLQFRVLLGVAIKDEKNRVKKSPLQPIGKNHREATQMELLTGGKLRRSYKKLTGRHI